MTYALTRAFRNEGMSSFPRNVMYKGEYIESML